MKYKNSDLGYFSFRVTNYPDWDGTLRVEFYDAADNLQFTATTTSTPSLITGSDALGKFVYVNGINLTTYALGLVYVKIYANYGGVPSVPYPVLTDAFVMVSGNQPVVQGEFSVSQVATLTMEFIDNGVLFDPLSIEWVKILDTNGNVVATLTPSRMALGRFQVQYFLPYTTASGVWMHLWRWKASPSLGYIEKAAYFNVLNCTNSGAVKASFTGLACSDSSTIDPIWAGADSTVLTLKRIAKRLKIFFTQGGNPYNPPVISVAVELDGKDVFTGSLATGEIKSTCDGIFFVDLPASFFSHAPRYYTVKWLYSSSSDSESVLAISHLFVINTYVYNWLPRFRLQVDKSRKLADSNFIGYTDAQLFYYLQGGLDEINMFPPTTMFLLDNWPSTYGQLLIDSGTVVAMISQKLYSVDTDVMTYSDQGFNYTIDHFARLNTVMAETLANIKDNLSKLKWDFNQLGSINIQVVPFFPLGVLLKTAPRGGLFRNLFASS